MNRHFSWRATAVLLLICAQPSFAQTSSRTERWGDALALGLPMIAAGMSLRDSDPLQLQRIAFTEAATVGSILLLKEAIPSARPNGRDHKSFPSGHAGVAFAAAHHLQLQYGPTWGWPAYAVASFVAWSRVDAREHRWRDVIAGGAIGVLSASWFSASPQTHEGRNTDPRSTRLSLAPGLAGGMQLSLSGRF